ncbi:hypothetical protein DC522_29635 [Microvirga sp. KLBC 81]|uniref:hypothetical protein n=1 Tax=Microvirga sp. KLBC 81 TaxID=1862707 RepID=UPI000D50B9B6|nr:hypothetical protein [Microvirga sp. KLBC 81]PVE20892.1 hypothetical protein DC522_29635 [Microvirga sp. KLBC 81]
MNAISGLLSLREPFGQPTIDLLGGAGKAEIPQFTPEGGGVLVSRGKARIEVREIRIEDIRCVFRGTVSTEFTA